MDPSVEPTARTSRARWIAAGFIGAFAASIFTVIYTGLNVEGTTAEFDAGFRSVTLAPGERREIELTFESSAAYPESMLELTLPPMLELATANGARQPVAVAPGANRFTVEVRAVEAGSGYIVARVRADVPVGLDRIFVTVTDE